MKLLKCVVMMCVMLMPLAVYSQDTYDEGVVDSDPAGEQNIGRFGLYLSLNPGILASGNLRDMPDESITPKPQSYDALDMELALFIFLNRYFGFEACYGFLGSMQGAHEDIEEPLELYDYWKIHAGPSLRVALNEGSFFTFVFGLAGGINYCSLDLNDDYKDLITDAAAAEGFSVEFNDKKATGVGGYARITFDMFFGRHFFLGLGLQYEYLNTKYEGASDKLDGHVISVPIRAGLAF